MNSNREPSPLYILAHINGNTVMGVLIDPTFWVNFITEEIMLINFLHRDGYDESKSTIRTHDGIYVPPFGYITLSILVGPRTVNELFDIILGFELFKVKLGIPWLITMNAVPLVVHKCLKFSHEGSVHVVHNTSYRPSIARGGYSLDHYGLPLLVCFLLGWTSCIEPM